MKKSFSIIELLIAISLFAFILTSLYQSLDISQKSNSFFSSKVEYIINENKIKKILLEDILESSGKIILTQDKNKNTILQLETSNMYHNVFFKYLTYILSKNGNLIRIESLVKFDKTKLNDNFFDNSYIDTVSREIKSFQVLKFKKKKKKKNILFSIIIEKKNKTHLMFQAMQI